MSGLGEKKTIIEVDYNDFEKFAKKYYSLGKWEFACAEEMNDGSSRTYRVSPKFDANDWIDGEETDFNFRSGMILDRLCFDGYIEQGEYIIKCSW